MKKNILLLHGWDCESYNGRTTDTDAWDYCDKLMDALRKNYNVYTLNFPGFCGTKEPGKAGWDVEDFAKYVDDFVTSNDLNIDIVMGYSFGGAVAVLYKNIYNKNVKLLLIAPAIIRNNVNSKKFVKTSKYVQKLRNFLRDIYVVYVVKNPEMKYASKFLRNTYQIIVRRDLRDEIAKIKPSDLLFLYGELDDAVDPMKFIETIPSKYKNRIKLIKGADHDNIVTDYYKDIIYYSKELN